MLISFPVRLLSAFLRASDWAHSSVCVRIKKDDIRI